MVDALIPSEWQDLSPTQRDVLVALDSDGPMIQADIAATIGYESHNRLVRAMPGLEDRGLVEPRDADDRPGKSKYWSLTEDGHELLDRSPIER